MVGLLLVKVQRCKRFRVVFVYPKTHVRMCQLAGSSLICRSCIAFLRARNGDSRFPLRLANRGSCVAGIGGCKGFSSSLFGLSFSSLAARAGSKCTLVSSRRLRIEIYAFPSFGFSNSEPVRTGVPLSDSVSDSAALSVRWGVFPVGRSFYYDQHNLLLDIP